MMGIFMGRESQIFRGTFLMLIVPCCHHLQYIGNEYRGDSMGSYFTCFLTNLMLQMIKA